MEGKKKAAFVDIIVVGFAMFAVFFGAGNLIFPPYLGMMSGEKWILGFLCFILADAGLAISTVLVMIRGDGSISAIVGRLGRKASWLISTISMLCVGPLICIPRTAATTYEMGMLPLVPGFNSWVFAGLFFAVVYILTIRPSGVVDVIGKFLTPMMIVTLAVLFIKGIVTPIGDIGSQLEGINVAREGFLAGYQTMDVLGALAITLVVVANAADRGYAGKRVRFTLISKVSIVAVAGLFIVYGGLTYLGATTSLLELGGINQAGLVVTVTQLLLKRFGVIMLALIVTFACLTTAIGLVSSSAEYFSALTGGRVRYGRMVFIMCLAGFAISNVGITSIIEIATPVLNVIYPVLITQVFLGFFTEKITNDNVFRGAAAGSVLICILGVAADFGAPFAFVHKLPFSSIGFYWLLPAIAGGAIGALIRKK